MRYCGSKVRDMQQPATWRELLRSSIENSQERQRVASELGVNPMTLMRWANGESVPRSENLRRLLSALPQHRDHLIELIEQEFEDFAAVMRDEGRQGELTVIPSEFYERVLHTCASTPQSLLFPLLWDLILQQALEQLDPRRQGMAITVATCMPLSTDQKVRSLRERIGRGTPPWRRDLEQVVIFLGVESLAGYVISSLHFEVNQNLRDEHSRFPGYRGPWEESAAAVPIMSMGKVAGSLLVSSTQRDYFLSTRCKLIESYAELIALAFAPEDFYEPQQISLGILPAYEVQRPYLSEFRKRVLAVMQQHSMRIFEAEQLVWQQIEAELLQSLLVNNQQEVP
jgi:transcriptional regulator with XRE-family HTH domain